MNDGDYIIYDPFEQLKELAEYIRKQEEEADASRVYEPQRFNSPGA